MNRPQVTYLPDGQRLHLHHGPIDMIVGVSGGRRQAALARAVARFETLLDELVAELPRLRAETGPDLTGETARLMQAATTPFKPGFITPMAAVAGAGADTILRAICAGGGIEKAYVNNGGDVAFCLGPGQTMTAAIVGGHAGHVTLTHSDPVRGVATSGWRGRSHSLGIADSVTVLARTAAGADAAATMIANALNLPGHPAIRRECAITRAPDSDLGHRLVTTEVGTLTETEVTSALIVGETFARSCLERGLIHAASLTLKDQTRLVGSLPLLQKKAPVHA